MNKTPLVLIAGFVLVIALGIAEQRYLETSGDRLLSRLDKVEAAAEEGRWPAAARYLKAFEGEWNGTKNKWVLFLHHREIDGIETSIARTDGFVKTKTKPHAIAEIANLKLLVDHIPAIERLSLRTVF
jgi:hypothetical protein